jgi:hypothetical protein
MILVVIAVLLIAGLELSRRRHPYPVQIRNSDVQDRDWERLLAELRAVGDRES